MARKFGSATSIRIDELGLSPVTAILARTVWRASKTAPNGFGEICQNIASREQCEDIARKVEDMTTLDMCSYILREMVKLGYNSEDIGFLLENADAAVTSEHLFVIDPIDGWLNYTAGLPIYCVGIAYFHNEQLMANAVAQPEVQAIFIAELGKGAYKLSPRAAPQRLQTVPLPLDKCMCDIPASPPNTIRGLLLHGLNNICPYIRGMRMTGSSLYSLCGVAANTLQVICRRFELCDIAPGLLIAQEAGVAIRDLDGTPIILSLQYPQKRILAVICHPSLLLEMLRIFHNYDRPNI